MNSIGLLLLLQIVLIALNAIFASAEIAVLSINEAKLERMANEGNGKAKRLFRLTREPAKFLATIQVAITLSGFLGSAFAADNFSEPLVNWVLGLGVNLPRATLDAIAVILITLIFGELVPKRLAMKKSEQVAMGISGLVSGISVIFKPIVWFLSVSTNVVLRLCGIDPNEAEDQVSEEEIRMMVDVGSEKGTIDHHEKEIIQNVFEFNDICAEEIATHRTDLTILWLEDDDQVWEDSINQSRFTRYPVCGDTADDVVGILNAKDYFRLADRSRENVLENAVHPAYFVPETISADVLFRNMRNSRNSVAVVMDEHGGLVGIVTMHDLIEELLGDLDEEPSQQDEPEPTIQQLSDTSWKLTGNVELEDLEAATGLTLENEDYETFTGLVFDVLGTIPADGQVDLTMELPCMQVRIQKILGHQIEEAVITLKSE